MPGGSMQSVASNTVMLKPITLVGRDCRLEPLHRGHADDLLTAAGHHEIWTYLDQPVPLVPTQLIGLIDEAAQAQERGERIPFAVPEIKLLLLTHLFEDEDAIRVCLKTDSRNRRSRRAISALGAKEEGILRNHRILRDGHRRHTAYYSITVEEWPEAKSRIGARLAASRLV